MNTRKLIVNNQRRKQGLNISVKELKEKEGSKVEELVGIFQTG